MSEMIDKVARALWVACGCQEHSDFDAPQFPAGVEKFKLLARAAIEAMREPTSEMLASLKSWDLEISSPQGKWRAMIDSALTGGK